MHVCDGVDPDLVAEHAVRQDEREAANDAATHAELRTDARIERPDSGKPNDQLHRTFDGRVEPNAATWTLLIVLISGCVQLGSCARRELDGSH
jgi:hypothetical protein